MWRCGSLKLRLTLGMFLGFSLALMVGCRKKSAPEQPTDVPDADLVTLSIALQPSSALALIAQEEGFYEAEGVHVRIRHSVSGKRALESMLVGEADIASSGDAPIAIRYFKRPDLRIVATIASSDNEPRIVARKDRGVNAPKDLRGKRIATQQRSAVHFFLHAFLAKYGMAESDVQLSFMRAEDLPGALDRGEIDAFSMREPQVTRARELLGDKLAVFAAPGLYERTENLVCFDTLTRSRPRDIRGILAALARSQKLVESDRDRAVQIVAKQLNIAPADLAGLWKSYDLRMRLDQSLLHTLEDIARWAMSSGATERTHIPNYLSILSLDGLAEVDPNAITVIR